MATSAELKNDELSALRRSARRRCLLVPGAGLALLGHTRQAILPAASFLVAMALINALAVAPSGAALWVLAAAVAVYFVASTYECFAVMRLEVRAVPAADHARRFRLSAMLVLLMIVVTIWVWVMNFRLVQVEDNMMSPAAVTGDVLAVSRFRPEWGLRPGQVVLYSAGGEAPGQKYLGRVRAVPGDKVSMDLGELVIDGKKFGRLHGGDPEHTIPKQPEALIVPAGQYLVVPDHEAVFDWVRGEEIISSRMMVFLSVRGMGRSMDE
ncbi:MAG: signal peptidase I [Planctomycetia bacterium]|nr:signal peptidase I [Planctomycetia bacterium]